MDVNNFMDHWCIHGNTTSFSQNEFRFESYNRYSVEFVFRSVCGPTTLPGCPSFYSFRGPGGAAGSRASGDLSTFPERAQREAAEGAPAMSTTTEAAKSAAATPVRCQRIGCDAMFTDDNNPEGSCQYHPSVSTASSALPSSPPNPRKLVKKNPTVSNLKSMEVGTFPTSCGRPCSSVP